MTRRAGGPEDLNGSRRSRIAKGSAVEVGEINKPGRTVLRGPQDDAADGRRMGGMGLPGMGGMPFGRGGGKKSRGKMAAKPVKAKGKGARSGNPAKRAAGQAASESAAATPDCPRSMRTSSCGCVQGLHAARAAVSARLSHCTSAGVRTGRTSNRWTCGSATDTSATNPCPARARSATDGILPGLVDLHCHVGLDAQGPATGGGDGASALSIATPVRCCCATAGPASDTRWMDEREDLPKMVRAGRHIALAQALPTQLGQRGRARGAGRRGVTQAARGDGWVKIVGDWIDREVGT